MNNILDFLKKYKKYNFQKDEILFSEGEKCNYVGFVISGEITIKSYVLDGKEIIYNVIKPGNSFGSNLIFSSNPEYRGDVIATEKSNIYLLNKNELISLLMSNQDFLEYFMKLQSDFSKELNLRIKLLTFNSSNDRLMYYLDACAGKIKYKTIKSLADYLNLSRESLSRCIHFLEKNNQILISKNEIVKL